MKFTDGYWQLLPGVTELRPRDVYDVEARPDALVAHAATTQITSRGDTLNCPSLTITLDSPAEGVIGVTIEHFSPRPTGPVFEVTGDGSTPQITVDDQQATITSGALSATVRRGPGWQVDFRHDGRLLTSSTDRSVAALSTAEGDFVREQLGIGVGERIYGLGERFGNLTKNGQSVEIWNADGGTSSDQAYKNVPFHLSNRGYGVLVDSADKVSYEIGTEAVSRTQFSVPGQRLRYYLIDGPTPADVLRRYTALTGRPPRVPAWSFGLWLSTSFTTNYDEATVLSFVDGFAERGLPLSVFHFDCFWMRQFHWCDFVWDPATFPDPAGLIARLHERGLKVCVWINPYIARRSHLWDEGAELGYLVRTADGSVWQWDKWQAGMALVDFTNPDAVAWYQAKLRELLGQGVDCFKTDFGERIPTDVVWHDGSDPELMHNYYTQLYNKAVFDLLVAERGEGEAVLFARSATVGGQQFPVHWGGDCESTFVSMAESLRGGLSLSSSGFGYWSHDIGGFEGTPDPAVFKRWLAFGLLSSHSRLHGSNSYRVPWAFDEEAVTVTRVFTQLKMRLMPYLLGCAEQAAEAGTPVMRPMFFEFPDDPGAASVETQYMLGPDLLVAPVFSADGEVDVYVPEGRWTDFFSGEVLQGPRWHHRQHGFDSLPLLVRPGGVVPLGSVDDRPEYDWADGVELRLGEPGEGTKTVRVPSGDGSVAEFGVQFDGRRATITGHGTNWLVSRGAQQTPGAEGGVQVEWEN